MSRGGLMLRCVREGVELDYVSLRGARHGPKPAKLSRMITGNRLRLKVSPARTILSLNLLHSALLDFFGPPPQEFCCHGEPSAGEVIELHLATSFGSTGCHSIECFVLQRSNPPGACP